MGGGSGINVIFILKKKNTGKNSRTQENHGKKHGCSVETLTCLGVYVLTVCRKENQMSSHDVGFFFPLHLNILKTKQCTKNPKTYNLLFTLPRISQ